LALVADMDHAIEDRRPEDPSGFGWGVAASVVLHLLAALLLTGVITGHVAEPLQDTVEVELVPPLVEAVPVPELQVPEPAVPEEDQVEAEEAPPPPPPPPPAPPETAETTPPPAEVTVAEAVEEFGEEETGPSEPDEEAPPADEVPEDQAAETEAEQAAPPDESADQEPAETEAAEAEAPAEDSEQAEAAEPDAAAADEDTDVASGTEAEADVGIADEATREDFGVIGPITTDATPRRKPPAPVQTARRPEPAQSTGQDAAAPAGLLPARQFFSRVILDDPQARSAMRGMSAGQRLNLLCMTELRAQIAAVSAVPPELLPSFRPPPGNVLQPRAAAFRSLGRWFDVAFRCETDSGVTRVERFAFKIGNEIPRSQWLQRGLTGF